MRATFLLLALGFTIALFISWVFDLTSTGVVRTEEAERTLSISAFPGDTFNYMNHWRDDGRRAAFYS